jgi:hypothetical protein
MDPTNYQYVKGELARLLARHPVIGKELLKRHRDSLQLAEHSGNEVDAFRIYLFILFALSLYNDIGDILLEETPNNNDDNTNSSHYNARNYRNYHYPADWLANFWQKLRQKSNGF